MMQKKVRRFVQEGETLLRSVVFLVRQQKSLAAKRQTCAAQGATRFETVGEG